MSSSTADISTPVVRTTKQTHPNLPPGLILGPDGKPCKVCNSWQDWAKLQNNKKTTSNFPKLPSPSSATTSSSSTSSSPLEHTTANAVVYDRSDCPPDVAQLGRSTWTFLHTTAAYYPLKAPPETQNNMMALLKSLSLLYPCSWCADDFQKDIKYNPPDVSGREGLSRWLCERHNSVNLKLGKERFECTNEKLDERWGEGPKNGRCD
ncbi:hypothetical protein M231_06994 [Tremella mesenterica]|uniref:Sulfhydryl oxidase n=1 Tax=Tremella mesenterica TaxID=5217 RepID=A0A4Q1BG24_TREME|nr:hypothetical protein M231_06994 [Tremella mesenterica]